MVRAILDEAKTQTRRVLKPQPSWLGTESNRLALSKRSPYGVPGDRLWVRERHALYKQVSQPARLADATYCCFPDGSQSFKDGGYHHWDKPVVGSWPSGHRWRPSIHMPRWASRITLELVDVRVQRVKEISEEDSRAEGATVRPAGWQMDWSRVGTLSRFAGGIWPRGQEKPLAPEDVSLPTARAAFGNYWNFIHGPGAWERNDWVWALTFKRLAA